MTKKIPTKELIHRAGSERALISICLNKPDQLILATSTNLQPNDFAVDGHRYIWMAMAYLVDKGEELDPISITNVYTDEKANEAINELGGLDYIEAMKGAPVAPNTLMFVGHIKQASARRAIYEEADKLKEKALKDTDSDMNTFLGDAEAKVRDIAIEYQVAQEVQKLGDGIGDRLKQRLLQPQDVIGLKTGWRAFDKASLGLVDGELTIVGARSKVGKSTVLLNWCKKISINDNIPVLYIDTEMYKEEQEDKLLSMLSGVPHSEIRNGMFGKDTPNGHARDKIKRVQEASRKLANAPFYHVYLPNFTLEKVQALARKYQLEKKVRLIVFDYIKLPSSNGNLGDKEYQALGYLTSGLKDIAGQLQVPVISAVQLNRGAVGKEDITEADIAGSDRILQLANRVCFLRRSTEEEFAYTGATHQFKIHLQRMGDDLGWTPVKGNGQDWNLQMVG
ncbi:AAA family ATPase [Bacillus sporothermodurans]|uniref:replicative DNA helicase n=1 Tax=Heyndrickxia sporothermodurans TaxID=46224 RepID=UPI001D1BB111|nr:replicative DNA helicase [Heyndrickxia sporothermodurans]MBL5776974.1 AAA family ATPase [Heyndrickxia sporothermodurans]MBL5798501.1 AAA family ATPase [Heyndrickxia sporothermodurans]MBL5809418.1 AAA family ATPase [Heyndrickxia sporothermodurans]MBL5813053.1 AAA family ATPase [Heyndrickxia sporothermodurans]MBL5816477.1 AAA family ATPase [Heyndrickxia sporothermodurans]